MNFGQPNVEIGQKMANNQLLFLALILCGQIKGTDTLYAIKYQFSSYRTAVSNHY